MRIPLQKHATSANARNKKMVKLLEATYCSLKGKNLLPQEKAYASISDLLHTLGPSEANAAPSLQPKERLFNAVDRPQERSKKILKTQYRQPRHSSINDLLSDLEEQKPLSKKLTKASKQKSSKKTKIRKRKGGHNKKRVSNLTRSKRKG